MARYQQFNRRTLRSEPYRDENMPMYAYSEVSTLLDAWSFGKYQVCIHNDIFAIFTFNLGKYISKMCVAAHSFNSLRCRILCSMFRSAAHSLHSAIIKILFWYQQYTIRVVVLCILHVGQFGISSVWILR